MTNEIRLGSFIREKRKKLKITQSDLAEVSNMTAKALSDIENLKADPKLSSVEKLLDNLGYKLKIIDRVSQ
jgi:transcriptional regulator with XRE-family HTH domain